MTREEAIRILEVIRSRSIVSRTSDALLMAIDALNKENEPAPSEDNTGYENQKKYFRNNNDTSKKAKCQEAINSALDALDGIYCDLSDKEQNIWNLGVTYERLLDAQQNEEDER